MAAKRRMFCSTMNSLFVTGQIGVKFGQKTSMDVFLLTLIEEFWKIFRSGVIMTRRPNSHFSWVSHPYRSRVTFFDLAITGRASGVPTVNRFFVQLGV